MLQDVDPKILQQCLAGSDEAFEKVYLQGKESVFNLALRYLGDPEWAEEVVQEVFLRVYNSLRKFKANSSFATWVFRIAINCCHDQRKRRKKVMAEAGGGEEALAEVTPRENRDPCFLATRKELGEAITQAFGRLRGEDRLALALVTLEKLTYQDVAVVLECSPGAAKMRVHRARMLFQKAINAFL